MGAFAGPRAQIGSFILAKAADEKVPEKWFRREVQHLHFGNIQRAQNIRHDEILHAMAFERAARRTFPVPAAAGEGIHIAKRPVVMTDRTFK
jgi:hypothetical protein